MSGEKPRNARMAVPLCSPKARPFPEWGGYLLARAHGIRVTLLQDRCVCLNSHLIYRGEGFAKSLFSGVSPPPPTLGPKLP